MTLACLGGRPLPAWSRGDVQEGSQRWSVPVTIREAGGAGDPANQTAGPVSHAPLPQRVPLQHLLRGLAAEWSYCR